MSPGTQTVQVEVPAAAIGAEPLIRDDEVFERMPRTQRIQHVILIACFTILVLTGLPLLTPGASLWQWLPAGERIFDIRSLVHRIAGVGLILVSAWHLAYVLLTEEGGRYFRDMMPGIADVRQAIQAFFYKLGLADGLYRRGKLRGILDRNPSLRFVDPPDYGKYNWIEKFEYLAVVWGNFVMILTGLALWYFEAAFALVSKVGMDIVKLVHGFEALLAFLAIAIWHMYNVHFNPEVFPMSRVWLSGKITAAQVRHHHPAWYRQIQAERRERRHLAAAMRLYDEVRSRAEMAPEGGDGESPTRRGGTGQGGGDDRPGGGDPRSRA